MVDIRRPNISDGNTSKQIADIRSYLYQMVDELNFALNNMKSAENGNAEKVVLNSVNQALTYEEARNTFNSIKSLIIKSADIVNAFYEETIEKLNGEYFAESDFGTYIRNTTATIKKNSEEIEAEFVRVEEIDEDLNGVAEMLRKTSAYIRAGLLDDDTYGVEVGKAESDGENEVTFSKYARFTESGLYFYTTNTAPVAWMQGGFLYIQRAIITESAQLGSFYIDTSDGFAIIPL